ncbi:MAG TPA: GNAT family N-acetyltransferase [Steroidobacteraceae bacterium]|nr:GNAT family N-acetyltransferase [Steroidobacteraceae bacterium]
MSWHLRAATAADSAAIRALIARSIRALGAADYSPQQIEGALRGAFGLDSQLIADGTYFVVESAGQLIGCGGWSYRRTLFGGDARAGRDAGTLDPRTDAAKIRAFFIDPSAARRGIGTALLERCEAEARRHGFRRAEMMATLPGVKLYAARGYLPGDRVDYALGAGLSIGFVPMSKSLTAGGSG